MTTKVVHFYPKKSSAVISGDIPLEEQVIAAMRTVYDPEIPVNIYDLGLIYDINIADDKSVDINMTLTAPGCPVAGILPKQVECAVNELVQVSNAKVTLVWDPPWSQERMSDEARLELDMF